MDIRPWELFKAAIRGPVDSPAVLARVLALPVSLAFLSAVGDAWILSRLLLNPTAASAEFMEIAILQWWLLPLDLLILVTSMMAGISWSRYVFGVEARAPFYRTDWRRLGGVFWAGLKAFVFGVWPFALAVGALSAVTIFSLPQNLSWTLTGLLVVVAIGAFVFAMVSSMRLIVAWSITSIDEPVSVRKLFRERKGSGWPTFAALLIGALIVTTFTFAIQFLAVYTMRSQPSFAALLFILLANLIVTIANCVFYMSLSVESQKAWRGMAPREA